MADACNICFKMEQKYQCHICMQNAHKPIVTPCGHLFCWQCIYHWLRSNQEYLTCPLCKSGLELSSVRPILLKNEPPEKEEGGVPPRPRPFRKIKGKKDLKEIPRAILSMGMNVQRGVMLAGYGIFPSVYQCLRQNYKPAEPNQDLLQGKNLQWKLQSYLQKAFYAAVLLFILLFLWL